MAKKKSWAQIKAQHHNARRSVSIVLDSEAALEAQRLAVELDSTPEKSKAALARRINALEEKAAPVTFVFEGVGRSRHQLLLAEHPPTAEQKDAAPEGMTPRFNLDTFPPALMAASCIEPAELRGDVEEWTEIHDTWSDGQVASLWGTCLAAQAGVNDAPKSAAASDVLANSASS